MARPKKDIDAAAVLKLAKLGCTTEEVGEFLGVSHDTISRRFAKEMSLGLADRKISLRRLQWKSANTGNVQMLIWLGKQYLGQSDKQTHDFSKIPDDELVARAKGAVAGTGATGADAGGG
jgi:hypothetical protein